MKNPLRGALGWLGRQGTRAVALSAILGMFLPPLSALFRPYVEEAIVLLLVLAFLRVDPIEVVRRLRRPALVALAVLWMTLVLPLGLGLATRATGVLDHVPDMGFALFVVTAAPPIMSAPAFIALLGLDGALSLAVLGTAMLATPVTAPLIGWLVLGETLPLDPLALALRLVGLLVATAGFAWVVRRLAGAERVASLKNEIDGLNVILLFFFAIAVMDGVAESFLTRPAITLAVLVLTFTVALGQMGLTALVFRAAAPAEAFVLAHAVGNRNMGLMVAALGGTLPDLAWLYFGLGQLPIYLLPWLLAPIAGRLVGEQPGR